MTGQNLTQPLWADHHDLVASRQKHLSLILNDVSISSAQRLIDCGGIATDAIEDQEAIGVLIGDEIIRRAGFEWVTIEDEYGAEPVVQHPFKIAMIAPFSAVLRRFEDGDVPFDIQDFIEEALEVIQDIEAKRRDNQT
jgi:hypothetical protein